jgi:TatD DNase family protein
MSWIYDAHIHLSDLEYKSDIDMILNYMDSLKIKACCVSMDIVTSNETLVLYEKSKNVLPFIGIHPEMAQKDSLPVYDLIEKKHKTITGIGEIGLDKTYIDTENEWKIQKDVFSKQLSLAEKYNKPVSIHSRKTLLDIFEILPSYKIPGILLHWFDGNKSQLKTAMDNQYFVSYGPLLVYANDKQVLLTKTDPSRLLVETDGPVKFSHCFEYKTTQIMFLPSVIFCASKLLHTSYESLLTQIEDNSKKFLGI